LFRSQLAVPGRNSDSPNRSSTSGATVSTSCLSESAPGSERTIAELGQLSCDRILPARQGGAMYDVAQHAVNLAPAARMSRCAWQEAYSAV